MCVYQPTLYLFSAIYVHESVMQEIWMLCCSVASLDGGMAQRDRKDEPGAHERWGGAQCMSVKLSLARRKMLCRWDEDICRHIIVTQTQGEKRQIFRSHNGVWLLTVLCKLNELFALYYFHSFIHSFCLARSFAGCLFMLLLFSHLRTQWCFFFSLSFVFHFLRFHFTRTFE